MKRFIVLMLAIAATAAIAAGSNLQQATSAADAAVTISIAGVSGQNVELFSVMAQCSAGSSSLEVKNGVGGTVVWSTGAADVGAIWSRNFQPLVSSTGNGMDIVLSACGTGDTGTLTVQTIQEAVPGYPSWQQTTGAAASAVTISIPAVAGESVGLGEMDAYCSAGTAGITIKDGVGGTVVWSSLNSAVGSNVTSTVFPTWARSSSGNGMDIVLSSCGSGNKGTLAVETIQN